MRRFGIAMLLSCLGGSCDAPTVASGVPPPDGPQIADQLRRLAQRRIYFAHQSVGGNVITGLELW